MTPNLSGGKLPQNEKVYRGRGYLYSIPLLDLPHPIKQHISLWIEI